MKSKGSVRVVENTICCYIINCPSFSNDGIVSYTTKNYISRLPYRICGHVLSSEICDRQLVKWAPVIVPLASPPLECELDLSMNGT